jgi:type III restriction enzyme
MTNLLENPILNSPFRKPCRHWELDEKGVPTGEALPDRRQSAYIVPIPHVRRTAGQAEFEYDVEGSTNVKTTDLVNRIRDRVGQWRELPTGQWGVTYETARLLEHWRDTPHAIVRYSSARWRQRRLSFGWPKSR